MLRAWIRGALWSVIALLILGVSAYALKDQALAYLLEAKLQRVAQKIGMPITFERATLVNLNVVRLHELRVGFEPLAEVKLVELRVERDGLFDLKPRPTLVYLHTPHIELGGRDQSEALTQMKRRFEQIKSRLKGAAKRPNLSFVDSPLVTRPQDRQAPPSALDPQALLSKIRVALSALPQLEIAYGSVTGGGGEIQIEELRLRLTSEQLVGHWLARRPQMGPCGLNASLEGARISCERDITVKLKDDLTVIGRELSWTPKPTPMIHLNGFTAELSGSLGAHLPFSELRADLALGLEPDERGERPINVTLRFPGGGAVQAQGSLSRERGELLTKLERFPAHAMSHRARGFISADVRLVVKPGEGELFMEGRLGAEGLVVEHEALAEEPIGPFELSTQGRVQLDWDPRDLRQMKVTVSDSELKLGELRSDLHLEFDRFNRPPRLNARFAMDRLKAQRFADSIPPKLLPHLQPLTLEGFLSFRGQIDLDMADLKATKLSFKPRLRRLKVLGHSEEIDFESLKSSFITEFTMPDGEIYVREVGPETERWVPLAEVPPLLVKSIVTQEDGGFYKHSGISLFHLRGSLVRNLSEGRFARGGSTLTMQLTRNLFLNKKKNLSRKLEELLLTWYLEKQLSKDEIIELYVNVVEFGPNLFGIREAAEHYFQKSPKELRPEEIVALTRLLPGPRLYAKFFERKRLSKAYTNRLNRLLALLVKRGHLEEGSFRKITPTNLWDPYEDEDSAAPEGSASPQQGAIEEPSHGTKPSVDPSALWGEPSYQAPPD